MVKFEFLNAIKMKLIMFLIILSGLFSCSKEINYSFQVENQTKYHLNEILFDWCNGDNKISVNPNSSTGLFSLTYKTRGANRFGPGSLCITVLSYSDTISTYQNTIGTAIERTKLDNKNTNVVIVSEKTDSSSNNIFSVELE